MYSFVLQDWTTIRGAVATVTQTEVGWLDLTPFQDVVFWVDVRESTNTPSLWLQTAPSKDEALFTAIVAAQPMATAVSVLSALMASATVPLGRFVRWQIAGTGTWDATFRIYVTANAPGL
jgi:hypothetical protein